MADWAGACAALKTAFLASWLNGAGPALKTPVGFPNAKILDVNGSEINASGPPVGTDGAPVVWAFFSILGNGGNIRGVGLPGNRTWLDRGLISMSIFAPAGYGVDDVRPYAVAGGEIFRAKTFYRDDTAGAKIVCYAPSIDENETRSQTPIGDQFAITASVPFEFYYIA